MIRTALIEACIDQKQDIDFDPIQAIIKEETSSELDDDEASNDLTQEMNLFIKDT